MLFLPKEVETVITTLQGAGYSPYLVGGCVREMLRGKAPSDYDMTSDALPQEVLRLFGDGQVPHAMSINVISFGFKYGIPPESDLVFDVRFLPNPYYEMSLRERNGTDPEVRDYVFQGGTADVLMRHLTTLIDFLLPRYIAEGKANLIISVGCTGGKHRSVTLTNALYNALGKDGHTLLLKHNDIEKDSRHKK